MTWRIFDRPAAGYEDWYSTDRGRRADAAERKLLLHLLACVPNSASAIEIGCGTGHFTSFLAEHGLSVVGLDRAPAMLMEARTQFPLVPLVLGDAHDLPFKDRSTDLVVFVTTLEFLEDPLRALGEAVRTARYGVVALVLNRRSIGGISRRWGPQARGSLLGEAHDFSLGELRHVLERAAAERLEASFSASTLFPAGFAQTVSHLGFGDVVGSLARLKR